MRRGRLSLGSDPGIRGGGRVERVVVVVLEDRGVHALHSAQRHANHHRRRPHGQHPTQKTLEVLGPGRLLALPDLIRSPQNEETRS